MTVISTAAARNIMQNVLGRNGGQQSLSGITSNVPTGDLNSIIANTAQRFTQPNSNQQETNRFPTQFTTDVNQQGSSNQFPTSQLRNDLLRQRVTNFQMQDQNTATSDRAEAISNFMNQVNGQPNQPDSVNAGANFPLLNRILQQGANPQFTRGDASNSVFQMVNEPSSQIGSIMQNFEGNSAAFDTGQLPPRVEQMFLPARQQGRNFVTITSNIPFSSNIQSDPTVGTVTFVPTLQQAADTGGSFPFITQTSTPETFITDSAAPARQRSSSLTNNVDWAMLDELMQQQSRQQRVTDSVTTNRASQPAATATDGFSLNQLDLSQFTANLDSLGATGLDPQQTAFLPVSTLQSSQTAAASLAAQETARAAAAQQRVAILASRRNQAAINALADSQAARNVAASQAARSAAASQAARSAVAAQAARSAAASQTRPVANMQDTAADQVLRRAVAEQSSDAVTLPAFQATRRRGPIFAIVPLTSRANIDDMRKFVQELSASINMASNEPTVGDNLLQSSLLPLGIQRETAAIGLPNASVAADSLPSVRPIQVINTVSAESNIPGEGPMTIMSDQPFAVPIPIQDPIAIRTEPVRA
ncbi:hypothetical protein KP79_PYT04045 [Mizuhopecten yessoensis]|uniref:Uncharacterized protein n=1 Tax=Mizuhopecten yessoensis TaxID=6573 RepID=A0A210QV14_MIZYE|nr:hypothetical protein KP79_PYT04045 [Mizuhopecten yessoensis]